MIEAIDLEGAEAVGATHKGGQEEVPDSEAPDMGTIETVVITPQPRTSYNGVSWTPKAEKSSWESQVVCRWQSGSTLGAIYPKAMQESGVATVFLDKEEAEMCFDIIGATEIPLISQAGDLVAAGLAFSRGDHLGGAMSLGAMIPIAGKYFDGAKWGRRGGSSDINRSKNRKSNKKVKKSSRALLKTAQLPTKGKIRFVPRKVDIKNGQLLRRDGGYVDRLGNTWKKGPSRTKGEAFEWDVQLSTTGKTHLGRLSIDGKPLNVSQKG